jgi:hypothetical protein
MFMRFPKLAQMRLLTAGFTCFILAACSGGEDQTDNADARDPIVEQALGDLLMVDPDLATQNEANAALTIGFDSSIPPLVMTPELIAKTRTATRNILLEGEEIVNLPAKSAEVEWPSLAGALSAGERGSRIGFAKECAQRINYSAIWAARLPEFAQPVSYAAVTDAAGNSEATCNIRIVSYLTPLKPEEVIHFHYNMAKRAGLSIQHHKGEEAALLGTSNNAALAVHARKRSKDQTEVDLILRQYKR